MMHPHRLVRHTARASTACAAACEAIAVTSQPTRSRATVAGPIRTSSSWSCSPRRFGRRRDHGRLILLRHGQSVWNVTDPSRGLTARFTGWADVGLTDRGRDQAVAAGRALAAHFDGGGAAGGGGGQIDCAFTSLLCRARDTMYEVLQEMDLMEMSRGGGSEGRHRRPGGGRYRVPVVSSWRLNERHYGALVGLSKEGAERLYGRERLGRWRNGWDTPPPPMDPRMVERWKREDHTRAVTYVQDPGLALGTSGGERGGETAEPAHCLAAGGTAPAARHSEHAGHGFLAHPIDRQHQSRPRCADQRGMHVATVLSEHPPLDAAESKSQRDLAIWEKPSVQLAERTSRRRPSFDSHSAPGEAGVVATPRPTPAPPSEEELIHPSRMPASESLRDTYERVLPLWTCGIAPRLRSGQTVLVVAHANTIRSVLGCVDPWVSTRKEEAKSVKIPSAVPLVYRFRPAEEGEEEEAMIIPGGLAIVPPDDDADDSDWGGAVKVKVPLSGWWIETEEIKDLSFCTSIGQRHLEHEIA